MSAVGLIAVGVIGSPLLGTLQDDALDRRLAREAPALRARVMEPPQHKYGFTCRPLDKAGSGKTTQVSRMLLDAGVAGGKRIVVLQPRRVAARAVASCAAWKLGGEVGYQVRFEGHLARDPMLRVLCSGRLRRK